LPIDHLINRVNSDQNDLHAPTARCKCRASEAAKGMSIAVVVLMVVLLV